MQRVRVCCTFIAHTHARARRGMGPGQTKWSLISGDTAYYCGGGICAMCPCFVFLSGSGHRVHVKTTAPPGHPGTRPPNSRPRRGTVCSWKRPSPLPNSGTSDKNARLVLGFYLFPNAFFTRRVFKTGRRSGYPANGPLHKVKSPTWGLSSRNTDYGPLLSRSAPALGGLR